MSEYHTNTPVRLTATFSWDGSPADPTTVTLKVCGPIRDPQTPPAVITYTYGAGPEIVRDGPGVYHFDLTAPSAGMYNCQWEGTGTIPVWAERQLIFSGKQLIT